MYPRHTPNLPSSSLVMPEPTPRPREYIPRPALSPRSSRPRSSARSASPWSRHCAPPIRHRPDSRPRPDSTRARARSLPPDGSGFSTAYIGSSNLTHSAQISGLEWNLRVSGARNPDVVEKVAAVFESYWNHPDFVAYERAQFEANTQAERRPGPRLALSDRSGAPRSSSFDRSGHAKRRLSRLWPGPSARRAPLPQCRHWPISRAIAPRRPLFVRRLARPCAARCTSSP